GLTRNTTGHHFLLDFHLQPAGGVGIGQRLGGGYTKTHVVIGNASRVVIGRITIHIDATGRIAIAIQTHVGSIVVLGVVQVVGRRLPDVVPVAHDGCVPSPAGISQVKHTFGT